jgi:hypothetical protein
MQVSLICEIDFKPVPTTLDQAVSSSLQSEGCAMAFSCKVESKITRINSFLAIILRGTTNDNKKTSNANSA